MTTTNRKYKVSLTLAATALLAWASPVAAEDCGSPCTVTRQGLPTFRLVNTVSGIQNWDLETSAFGVELAPASDIANTGAFRVEHGAVPNALVIDELGRVGINTTVPVEDLQINGPLPTIRLDNTQAGAGQTNLMMLLNTFVVGGTRARVSCRSTPGRPRPL